MERGDGLFLHFEQIASGNQEENCHSYPELAEGEESACSPGLETADSSRFARNDKVDEL